ncbi:DUF971 domain-containing protein [Flagellatimonas centrodinii]|uniref:gamma-butyrobetaine hydroxylase-like domain-containing protein n=1 Tax=Flagellatimonas centrodinii TaxID=2806210 RepID=UPI001FFC8E32|nr:DUF971 domain-containing protein [Flagellatimonas centrodinii]ULQ45205.1 DUF971 domain-containing protein [Flagellatimonas centrodinii]
MRITGLKARRSLRVLEVTFSDDRVVALPFEFLRVYSPSAELWGHGRSEPLLVGGRRAVGLDRIEPVGHYAVRLVFDDGHDSGLFSWDVLDRLAREYETLWARYLDRLAAAGMSRDRDVITLRALRPGPDG